MLTLAGKPLAVPILQGGMGVGVSLGGLAGAVAACGGMGCISTADTGYREPDFAKDPVGANRRALAAEIQKAKEIANGAGLVAINAMVATQNYADAVKTAVEAGVDAIVSGAGLPLELPGLVEKADVALAPIVSSGRAARLILRRWAKSFGRTADFVVIEGCKAGGHLGFSEEELLAGKCQTLDEILPEVLAEVKPYEEQFGHAIPVFVAGGVYTGEDIAHYARLGAAGAQLATRFAVRDKLRVVYLEEYCVSLSEHLMPAAEVSEQISLAGTEASGTGNMKFMLNGAITLGTLDGANVEIADAAGKENELIFGMLTPEVNNLKQVGYHPNAFITGDDVANAALNFLERGWNGENFHEVTENLRSSDPYMVMADFKDYRRAQADLQRLYADREHWAKMSLKNIANSGIFSADRAVLDYARDIWHASAVK